jgi:hypothetical protein
VDAAGREKFDRREPGYAKVLIRPGREQRSATA